MGTREHNTLKEFGCTYYFTATVIDWRQLFIKPSCINILIGSILFFQNNRQVYTNGYCIMPNHLHWIFTLPEQMNDVIRIIQSFKSFTAVQILKELKKSKLYNNEHVAKIFDGNKNIITKMMTGMGLIFYLYYDGFTAGA